jgi:hypothetical protein
MAITPWALEALIRGVGSVVDKVPPDKIDQIRQKANQLLDELPQTAARGVESVLRGAKAGKQILQRWSQRHLALVTPVINASGNLSDPRVDGTGLTDAMIEFAAGATRSPLSRSDASQQRLSRRLNRCTGDPEIGLLVAASVEAACMAVGITRRGRTVWSHRSQGWRLPSGLLLGDAIAQGSATGLIDAVTCQVGAPDGVESKDIAALPDDGICVAIDLGQDSPAWYQGTSGHAGMSGHGERLRVIFMPVCAGIAPPSQPPSPDDAASDWLAAINPRPRFATQPLRDCESVPPVADVKVADVKVADVKVADVVIAPGNGLLGGPTCGLIIAPRHMIDEISSLPSWQALRSDPVTRACMTMALESALDAKVPDHVAAESVTTAEENLKHRAEKISIRLAADESILSCQITAEPAGLIEGGAWRIPSRQLRIKHRDKASSKWAESLAEGVPSLLTRVEDDLLTIDLRWVKPADDSTLVAALLGYAEAGEAETTPSG